MIMVLSPQLHWRFMGREMCGAVRGRGWRQGETEEGESPDPNARRLSR